MHRGIRSLALLGALCLAGALLAGCGSSNSTAKTLDVTKAWARTSASVQTSGAAYLTITNGTSTDDTLTQAAVPASVAKSAELHQTMSDMGSMGGGSTGGGSMSMQPVAAVTIPAGETLTLAPGGFHIMLMDLTAPLTAGQTFPVTLTFSKAGDKTVTATVRDTAP